MRVQLASLGKECQVITKGTTPTTLGFSFSDAGIPFLRVQNLESGTVRYDRGTLFIDQRTHQALRRSQIEPRDVLVSIAGTIGRAAVVPESAPPLNCNQAVAILRPSERLLRDYLRYWLESPEAQAQIRGSAVTGTISNLSLSQLAGLQLPLPPMAQQVRVAAILDHADTLRAKRRAALAELDTLTQSIFLEMFGDASSQSTPWPVLRVSDYVAEFQGGKSIESEAGDSPVTRNRVLKVSAVRAMEFLPSESKPVPDTYAPPCDHFVKPGDLLFSRANTAELVGAVSLVEETPPNLLLPDKLWRFVWKYSDQVDPLFICALFQTRGVRQEISRRATGTSGSMKNISQEKLFGISTIMPPVLLQREFARRFRAVAAHKAAQKTSQRELDALFSSLQNRAFRGEL